MLDTRGERSHHWEFVPVRDITWFFFLSLSPPLPSTPLLLYKTLFPFFLLFSFFFSLPTFFPPPSLIPFLFWIFSSYFPKSVIHFGPYLPFQFLTPRKHECPVYFTEECGPGASIYLGCLKFTLSVAVESSITPLITVTHPKAATLETPHL